MTGQILVGVAHYIWQAFREGPNTALSKARANQTNSNIRGNVQQEVIEESFGTSHGC